MEFIINHLGEIAGIVSFSAAIFYIIAILKGETKPSRSTWWILTLVGVLIFATSYTLGATESMWIQIGYIVGPLIFAILSLFPKYGYGEKLLLIDKVCLLGALVCGVIWLVFNSPFIAFLGSILVDFIGLIPTIKKVYLEPKKESPSAWGVELIASILNTLGISVWFTLESKDWIYALYLVLVNGLVTILILLPRLRRMRD